MEEEIQVYVLVPALELYSLADGLQSVLFDKPGAVNTVNKLFTVAPSSGWITYNDNTELWQSTAGTQLATAVEDVIKAAETFCDAANRKTAQFNDQNKTTFRSLLPDKGQRALKMATLIRHPDGPWADHWLCSYEIVLNAGVRSTQRTYVYGMGMDIRLGRNNKIISLVTRWRPVKNIIYTKLFARSAYEFLLPKREGEEEPEASPTAAKQLIYVYDGNAGNQYYVAPYYFEAEQDHIKIFPASRYSLFAVVGQEDRPQSTRLTAYVYGGSGNYEFNWAYWNLSTLWGNGSGAEELGSGDVEQRRIQGGNSLVSSITLPYGSYNVMVNIVDRQTAAYAHVEQTVFSQVNTVSDALV